jgi:hypothetical protein
MDMRNRNYDFIEKTELIADNRFFKIRDIPKKIQKK